MTSDGNETLRTCRCAVGICTAVVAILCAAGALILNEITRVDLTQDLQQSEIDALGDGYKAYWICAWDEIVLCTGTDCADAMYYTGYTNIISPVDIPKSDNISISISGGAIFKDVCDSNVSNKDAACEQYTTGLIWFIATSCAIAFGIFAAFAICCPITRKFASFCSSRLG